jgi:hypothetical protein
MNELGKYLVFQRKRQALERTICTQLPGAAPFLSASCQPLIFDRRFHMAKQVRKHASTLRPLIG